MTRSWKLEMFGALILMAGCSAIVVSSHFVLKWTGTGNPSLSAEPNSLGPIATLLTERLSAEDGPGLLGVALQALRAIRLLGEASFWIIAVAVLAPLLVLRILYVAFAGAVFRATAEHLPRAPKTPRSKHYRFARRRILSMVAPSAVLAVGWVLLVLAIGAVSLGGRLITPWLNVVAFPLLAILGAAGATLLLGLILTAPMSVAAVAIEGRSLVDALSRSFHYTFAKPWQALMLSARGYTFASAGAAFRVAFLAVILGTVWIGLSLTLPGSELDGMERAFLWLLGYDQESAGPAPSAAHWAVAFLGTFLLATAGGHFLGQTVAHQAVAYIYLREVIDGTPPYEICPDPADPQPTDDAHSIPPEAVGLSRVE